MSLERYLEDSQRSSGLADELRAAAPTISALARLCGSALCYELEARPSLSLEAEAILFAARKYGSFELKVTNAAVDPVDRFIAVHVQVAPEELFALRLPGDAAATMRWFEGFRELCAGGFVVHHIDSDFSLTSAGFEKAKSIQPNDVQDCLRRVGLLQDAAE